GGQDEAFERHVGADERTARLLRKVEARPAASGADVEQTRVGVQLKASAEFDGLFDRGVAVGSPHGADDITFDAVVRLTRRDPIAVREVGAGRMLVATCHPPCPALHTQNSLPSGSAITTHRLPCSSMASSTMRCAPSASSRAHSSSTVGVSMSKCMRFLAD